MADLVTRLRLDSQEFDDNIRRSRLLIQNFQNIQSSVTSSIKALGGQFLAAAGLVETFSTAINSNSTLLETWSDVCGTAKESVDNFFTSLTNGDWSIFEKGITNAIKLSRQYTQSMRELRTSIKIGDVRLSQDEKELNKYENLASDESRSKGDREAAYATFKKKGEETVAYVDNLSKYVNDKLSKILESKGIKNTKPVREIIFEYLDPSTVGSQLLAKYTVLYDLVQKAYQGTKAIATNPLEALAKSMATENLKKYQAKLESFKKAFPLVEEAYRLKLNFSTLEELDELLDFTDKIIGYEDRLESAKKLITDVSKDFDKNGKLKPKTNNNTLGSKETAVKSELLFDFNNESWLNEELKGFHSKLKRAAYNLDPIPITYTTQIQEEEDPSDLPLPTDDGIKDIESADFSGTILGLSGISSLLNSINGLTNEGAAAWVTYGANILSAVGQAIPAIAALTAIKHQETVANTAAAATGAASSLASIPIVGPILAVAAIATVLAAIAAIPTFANGGIFESPLTTGDRNLARLNGGEMILNKGQQYNLFKLLDNGSSINGGGEVTFKLRGSDIYGSLSNYNKKFSKVR